MNKPIHDKKNFFKMQKSLCELCRYGTERQIQKHFQRKFLPKKLECGNCKYGESPKGLNNSIMFKSNMAKTAQQRFTKVAVLGSGAFAGRALYFISDALDNAFPQQNVLMKPGLWAAVGGGFGLAILGAFTMDRQPQFQDFLITTGMTYSTKLINYIQEAQAPPPPGVRRVRGAQVRIAPRVGAGNLVGSLVQVD